VSRYDRITRLEDGKEIPGLFHEAFIHNGDYQLTQIEVYQDGMIDCWGLGDIEEFKQHVARGWVVTTLPEGARISIGYLAHATATDVMTWIKEEEFIKEVLDDIEYLNGRPTADILCIAAYEKYQQAPTKEARQTLRVAYEAIPEHNRDGVLGDMDLKDIPIRMIIYGDDEIENWSHRALSRALGVEPLPNIVVPHPAEEDLADGLDPRA
jgi:hypothetical protein